MRTSSIRTWSRVASTSSRGWSSSRADLADDGAHRRAPGDGVDERAAARPTPGSPTGRPRRCSHARGWRCPGRRLVDGEQARRRPATRPMSVRRTTGSHVDTPRASAAARVTTSATMLRLTSRPRPRTPHCARRQPRRAGRGRRAAARTLAPVARTRPVGVITRGTTNPNRLRRCDRWLAGPAAWRLRRSRGPAPVVVDLGYGASPVTAVELHDRLSRVRPDVEVVGIEIDPERVAAGRLLARPGLSFRLRRLRGAARRAPATVVRAFNVLRQYPEEEVAGAWATVLERLTPDGLLVDGTCDELGRLRPGSRSSVDGPVSLVAVVAAARARARPRSSPSGCRRRSSTATSPASRSTTTSPSSTGSGPAARARGIRCASTVPRDGAGDARERLAAARRPGAVAAGELTVAWDAVAPAVRPRGVTRVRRDPGASRCRGPARSRPPGGRRRGRPRRRPPRRWRGGRGPPSETKPSSDGDAGDGHPELLGALAGRDERVGPRLERVDEGEHLERQCREREHEHDVALGLSEVRTWLQPTARRCRRRS